MHQDKDKTESFNFPSSYDLPAFGKFFMDFDLGLVLGLNQNVIVGEECCQGVESEHQEDGSRAVEVVLEDGEGEWNGALEDEHEQWSVGDVFGFDSFSEVHGMDGGKTEAEESSKTEEGHYNQEIREAVVLSGSISDSIERKAENEEAGADAHGTKLKNGFSSEIVDDVDGEENSDNALAVDENGKKTCHWGVDLVHDLAHVDVDDLDGGHLLENWKMVGSDDRQDIALISLLRVMLIFFGLNLFFNSASIFRNPRFSFLLLRQHRMLLQQLAVLPELFNSLLNVSRFEEFAEQLPSLIVATFEHQIFRSFVGIFVDDVVDVGSEDYDGHEEDDSPVGGDIHEEGENIDLSVCVHHSANETDLHQRTEPAH